MTQIEKMIYKLAEIEKKVVSIDNVADPESRYYGKLLNWPDIEIDIPIWPFDYAGQ